MTELKNPSFKLVPKEEKQAEKILRPSTTFLQEAWYRFRRNKLGIIGSIIVLFMVLFAVFGPYLCKYDYITQDLRNAYSLPSSEHLFGTDNLGRDLLVRMCYGARISLACGFVASIISLVIGVTYGAISGFIGGTTDNIMMRIVDIISAVPSMLYVILLMVVIGNSLKNVFLVIGITGWLGMARLVRSQVMALKQREYVLAARVSNVSDFKIILKHLVPNSFGPIVVQMTLSIPSAIFLEASLQFLGLGISAPMPSWGGLAQEGIGAIRSIYSYLMWIPAIFISVTILAFNFLGDALRDALDPQQK